MPASRAGRILGTPSTEFLRVEPPISQIKLDIMQLSDNIGDFVRPMQLSKQLLIDDTKAAFVKRADPRKNDRPWVDLSVAHAAQRDPQKKRGNRQLNRKATLRKTDKLYKQVTSVTNWSVHIRKGFGDIQLNTSRFPIYWRVHQFGKPPGYQGTGAQQLKVMDYLSKKSGGNDAKYAKLRKRFVATPQRGYIGGGLDAILAIEHVMDGWANNAIAIHHWRGGKGRLVMRSV